MYQEFRIEDKSGQLGNLPLVQGFVLQGFALPPRSVRRKCSPCYHGAHHCKASPCHHGAATSERQSRDGLRKDISWQSHARQSQSFVVGVGVGIFFVHLIVLCFLFLHFILFFCLLP